MIGRMLFLFVADAAVDAAVPAVVPAVVLAAVHVVVLAVVFVLSVVSVVSRTKRYCPCTKSCGCRGSFY